MTVLRASIAALCLALAATASAEPRRIGVVSLIADRFLVVSHDAEVGGHTDRNRHGSIELPDRTLDKRLALRLEETIKAAEPSAEVVLLAGNDALYAAQGEPSADPDVRPVVDLIRGSAAAHGLTHLLIVTKLRRAAHLRLAHTTVGSGSLEGVGFYLDHTLWTRRSDTGERARGMLAPFAYFRVCLVDLSRDDAITYRDVVASTGLSAARSDSLRSWDTLGAEDKARLVGAIMQREGSQAAASLLQGS